MKASHFIARQLRLLLIVLLAYLAAGCRPPTPQPPPPGEILARAAGRMKSLHSFHFLIDRSGALAYLDAGQSVAFARAEGDFYAPDQARATIRVILPGLVAEVQMIALGDEYWETGLLSNQWEKLPPGAGFNPATLFDPQSGFQEILGKDLGDLSYQGLQELGEIPGQLFYTLSGRLEGERLYELSYGLIGPQAMEVSLWVAVETFEVYRVQIDEPLPPGESDPNGGAVSGESVTRWRIDFWEFNEVKAISPPPGG